MEITAGRLLWAGKASMWDRSATPSVHAVVVVKLGKTKACSWAKTRAGYPVYLISQKLLYCRRGVGMED